MADARRSSGVEARNTATNDAIRVLRLSRALIPQFRRYILGPILKWTIAGPWGSFGANFLRRQGLGGRSFMPPECIAAKKAINEWISNTRFDKQGVTDAVVELFDGIYSQPLFNWRAVWRSTIMSLVVLVVVMFELNHLELDGPSVNSEWSRLIELTTDTGFLDSLITNIISDYISLFFVRGLLTLGSRWPIAATILGAVVGAIIVLSVFYIRSYLLSCFSNMGCTLQELDIWLTIYAKEFTYGELFYVGPLLAAMTVHLWLPACSMRRDGKGR